MEVIGLNGHEASPEWPPFPLLGAGEHEVTGLVCLGERDFSEDSTVSKHHHP